MALIQNGVKLAPSHLLLLETIKGLSLKNGYCYATNYALSKIVFLSQSRVSHLVSELKKAGLVTVKLFFDSERPNMIIGRHISPVAIGVAQSDEEHNNSYNTNKQSSNNINNSKPVDNVDNSEIERETKSLVKDALTLGIAPFTVMQQVIKHSSIGEVALDGIKFVKEKLAIVKASNTVREPWKLFLSACNKDYSLGKRAKCNVNRPAYPKKQNKVVVAPVIKSNETINPNSSFVKELFSKLPNVKTACLA